jgi:hypothetical protein
MRIATLYHTEMAREFAMLRAVVSSPVEFTLRCSTNETFRVEVLDKLIAEFRKQEEWCSHLERPGTRVCDLILGPPSSQARLADQLEETIGRLGAGQAG